MLRCSDVDGATPQGALPSLGCWWRGLSVCQGGSAGTWEVPGKVASGCWEKTNKTGLEEVGTYENKSIVFNLRYIYNHHDNENNLPLPLTTVMIGHYENREIIDQYILTSGQVDFLDDWSLDMEEDVTPAARSSSKWLSIVLVYSTIQWPFQDLNWRYLPYKGPIISDPRI